MDYVSAYPPIGSDDPYGVFDLVRDITTACEHVRPSDLITDYVLTLRVGEATSGWELIKGLDRVTGAGDYFESRIEYYSDVIKTTLDIAFRPNSSLSAYEKAIAYLICEAVSAARSDFARLMAEQFKLMTESLLSAFDDDGIDCD